MKSLIVLLASAGICQISHASLPSDTIALINKVSETCSGNASSYVTQYSGSFSASTELKNLKNEDAKAMGVDCRFARVYGASASVGAGIFAVISKPHEDQWAGQCLQENLTKDELVSLKNLFFAKENIGVLTSAYSELNSNSEGCNYYNFWIYRNDGSKIELTFNYTD